MLSSLLSSNGSHLLVLRQSDGVSPNASQPTSGLSISVIIGIAIGGGVLVLALIIIAGWCCCRGRRERKADLARVGDAEFASNTSLHRQNMKLQREREREAFGHGLPAMALTVDALRPSLPAPRPSSPYGRPGPDTRHAHPAPSPLRRAPQAPQEEPRDSGVFMPADVRQSNERYAPNALAPRTGTNALVPAAPTWQPPVAWESSETRRIPAMFHSTESRPTTQSRPVGKHTQRPYSMDSESIYSAASAPRDALDRPMLPNQSQPHAQPQRRPSTAEGLVDESSTTTGSDPRQSTAQSETSSAFGPYFKQAPASFDAAIAQMYAKPDDASAQIPRTPAKQPMLMRKPRAPGPAAAAPGSGLATLAEVETPPTTPGAVMRPALRVDTFGEPLNAMSRPPPPLLNASSRARPPPVLVTPLLLTRKRRADDEQVPASAPPLMDGFLAIPPSPMSAPPVPPSPYSPMLPHLANTDAPPPALPRKSSKRVASSTPRRASRRASMSSPLGPAMSYTTPQVRGQPLIFTRTQPPPPVGSAAGRF